MTFLSMVLANLLAIYIGIGVPSIALVLCCYISAQKKKKKRKEILNEFSSRFGT